LSESVENEERSPELQRAIELAHAKLQAARARTASTPTVVVFSDAHEAAAVVSRFRIASLENLAADRMQIRSVVSDSVPIADRSASGFWTLLPDVRADILRHLSRTNRFAKALAGSTAIAEPNDPLRAALTALETDGPNALRVLPLAPLSSIVPFVDAVGNDVSGFPSRREIDRRLELLRLLEPFDRLVGKDFEGREAELRDLRIYVDVLQSKGFLETFARAVSWTRKKPFLIFGVGGVGKSTLVGKFIQDHTKAAEWTPFPFAYLDFDRRTVMVDEPASILVEAVRQIGLQYEQAADSAEALRRSWRSLLASAGRSTKGGPRSDVRARDSIRRDFVAFIQKLEVDSLLPVLLVLDTFEEVQYRSRAFVETLRDFIGKLAEDIPKLRVVIVGRASVPEFAFEEVIELAEFEEQSALAFLRKNGIANEELATTIFKQVGGNPLTLRLATAVFRIEQETSGNDFTKLAFVRKKNVQGQLFERILRHVHDPDVRRIAHPGLILRRVTPEIIRDVLAGPCGLDVATLERAQDLFNELQREIALVSPAEEPGVVKHRPDVRKIMLKALRDEEPVRVQAIHHAAVEYYRRFEDAVSRGEEIYHLLSLGELDEARQRFLPDVKANLWNALDEFNAPEKALLADLLGMEIPEDSRASASLEIWERAAVRSIDEYLKSGVVMAAVALLDERTERSAATMLRVREAAVYVELGRSALPSQQAAWLNKVNPRANAMPHERAFGFLERAAWLLSDAVRAYTFAGNWPAAFEALLASADLARRRNIPATADAALKEAETLARAQGDDIWLLRALVARRPAADNATAIDEIRSAAARIDEERWFREPALLRKTAAIVGAADVNLVQKAVRIAGGYSLRAKDERKLEEALAGWGRTVDLNTSVWKRAEWALGDSPSRLSIAAVVAQILGEEMPIEEQSAASRQQRGPKLKAHSAELAAMLLRSGVDVSALGDVLVRRFDRNVAAISFAKEPHAVFTDVLFRAEGEGWLAALLDALRQSATPSARLLSALDDLGIGVRVAYAGGPTLREKVLAEQVHSHRTAILLIEQRICRIEVEGAFRGTGFLIGPSHVLTSEPVVDAANIGETVVRFDYGAIGETAYSDGVPCTAKVFGFLAERLCVLELARPVAEEPVGGGQASHNSPARRTLDLRSGARVDGKSPIFWFWHSEKDGLQVSGSDALTVTDEGIALQANDRDRFAGGPCFDQEFRLVGVQCGPHPSRRRECLIMPVSKVVKSLEARELGSVIAQSGAVRMTSYELAELRDVIMETFDLSAFRMLLADRFRRHLPTIPMSSTFMVDVSVVLQHFHRLGLIGELIEALAIERPQESRLDELRRRYLGR